MHSVLRSTRAVVAVVATTLTTLVLTATAALARPLPPPAGGRIPDVVQQQLPVTTTIETGLATWAVVAIAILAALATTALTLAAARFRSHHVAQHSAAV